MKFRSIFRILGKCSKTHTMSGAWNISAHTLLKIWELLPHQIRILLYTSSHRKHMGLWMSHSREIAAIPILEEENLGNWKPSREPRKFSQSMGASMVSYGILHTMGNDEYFLQYSIAWEYVAKPILWGESGKLIAILSHSIGSFLPSDPHLMVCFFACEIHWFFNQILIAWENAEKPIL